MQFLHPSYDRKKKQKRTLSRRRGVVLLQAIIAIPILLIASLAVIQIAMVMQVQQAVSSASLEGAHAAANGSDFHAVVDAVGRILAIHGIDLEDENSYLIELERHGQRIRQRGRRDFSSSRRRPRLRAGEIRVNVTIAISDANGNPVPDWLQSFGFSWSNRVLNSSATMTVE